MNPLYSQSYKATMLIGQGMRDMRVLYRFFSTEAYADRFVNGYIWISTLEACRNAENAAARDEGEGSLLRHVEYADGDDPQFMQMLAQTGLVQIKNAEKAPGVRMTECFFNVSPGRNGYVLCLTERCDEVLREKFGGFCVKVNDPFGFFQTVTPRIGQVVPITVAEIGRISYLGRKLRNYEGTETPIEFIKPHTFAPEKEVRMYWAPRPEHTRQIQHFELPCPEAARFCERIC